MNNNMI